MSEDGGWRELLRKQYGTWSWDAGQGGLERNLEGLLRVRAANTTGRVSYFPRCTAFLLRARSSTQHCPVATAHVSVVTK